MTSFKLDCIERRGRGLSSEESRSCRESPDTAGPQRVLERRYGDAGTSPDVCSADAGCCSSAGEGLFVSSPSLPAQLACAPASLPPSTPQRDSNVGFSACAGLVGDAPLGLTRARNTRPPGWSSSRHPQCTAPHHVYSTANGMSKRSGTIILQTIAPCSHIVAAG